MSCMKCGRDTDEGQVFCQECLNVMAKYPVKPGIAIQLPSKKETSSVKKAAPKRKQPPTPEEQLKHLRRRVKRMAILWLVTFLLMAAMVYPTVRFFQQMTEKIPGQNYSTIVSTDETKP